MVLRERTEVSWSCRTVEAIACDFMDLQPPAQTPGWLIRQTTWLSSLQRSILFSSFPSFFFFKFVENASPYLT